MLGMCFLFILLRLPSLIEPHWYGDEGIYQVIGRALIDGKVLYKEIWDNKPPLLYVIYAIAGGNLYIVKLLSLLSGTLSVIVFFLFSKKLFKKSVAIYFSTFVYTILFATPVIEGNIANAENFMLLPIVGASYLLYSFTENNKKNYLIISGFLLSIAFAIKIVAIFDFAAFLLFLYLVKGQNHKKLTHFLRYFIMPFASIMAFFMIYFFAVGAFPDFLNGVFFQNISYVGEQYGAIFPQGILIIKTVILLVFCGLVIFFRKRFDDRSLFIYIWIIFALYSAFFSYRPYTHYLLVILPAFALLLGQIVETNKLRFLGLLTVIFICAVAYYQITIYRKNIAYYNNFIEFISGQKNITSYQNFFDRNTPRDYNIANFIDLNVKNNETVFLWSDSAQIYALSNKLPIGKYIVAYHMTYYEDAEKIMKNKIDIIQPKYIIQTSLEPMIKEFLNSYRLKYIMNGTNIYEREI